MRSEAGDDRWPLLPYWLAFLAAGAAISYFFNRPGSHSGDGVLGAWLFSLLVASGVAVSGCLVAMFAKTRLVGIAMVATGLGGLAVAMLFLFGMMPG
jgi:hypothetical protein